VEAGDITIETRQLSRMSSSALRLSNGTRSDSPPRGAAGGGDSGRQTHSDVARNLRRNAAEQRCSRADCLFPRSLSDTFLGVAAESMLQYMYIYIPDNLASYQNTQYKLQTTSGRGKLLRQPTCHVLCGALRGRLWSMSGKGSSGDVKICEYPRSMRRGYITRS